MISALLLRGMLAGVLAGLLSFAFATAVTEPLVDKAIVVEEVASVSDHHEHEQVAQIAERPHEHGTVVSRSTQSGIGLLVGLVVLGAGVGGLFSLVFAFCRGRIGSHDSRRLSFQIACGGFLALVILPTLKYPANPPGVGNADTIGGRTVLFFSLLLLSAVAMAAALQLYKRLVKATDSFNAGTLAGAFFLVAMTVILMSLPSYDEAPLTYPASLLWHFRLASIETQAVMWLTLGMAFGISAYRLDNLTFPKGAYTTV